MSDLPPQFAPPIEESPSDAQYEAGDVKQSRREAEREALVADTNQREATVLEDTEQLFTQLAAYLRGELSGMCLYGAS